MSDALVPRVLYSTPRGERRVQHHGQRPASDTDVTSYLRFLDVCFLRLLRGGLYLVCSDGRHFFSSLLLSDRSS